jgi:hypothetical protein
MSILTQVTAQEELSQMIDDHIVTDATAIAKEFNWNIKQLLVSQEASFECVDDITSEKSADSRLRKLVIAANYARKSNRKRFELPVINNDLGLTTNLLEINHHNGYVMIDLKH